MNTSALEKTIAATLACGTATKSNDVASLISETEQAIAAADKTAAAVEAKALDLTMSPDAGKARAAMEEAAWARDRLRAALPKLQQQLTAVYAAEDLTRWQTEYSRVKVMVEEEAKKFVECRSLMAQLAERFAVAKAVDEEVHRVNASRPSRVSGMHLDEVELTARELQSFSRYAPSVVDHTVLQTWEPGGRSLWPPPRVIDPSMFGPVPLHDPKYSDHWWENSQAQQQILLERAEKAANG